MKSALLCLFILLALAFAMGAADFFVR